jgi:protein-L-isoaspartate(D-aspartate) O-methyltransferase
LADATALRNALVDQLKQNQCVTDARVEQALRDVPRHLFVPDVPLDQAYADDAIVTKTIDDVPVSSISQPAIVAIMLEQLAPRPGGRVLEIGAGTGYNAALLAHLVGTNGHVTTIDLDEDIVAGARENLARANVTDVQVICADGGFGYAPNAPYDAIIATVGIWDISPHWFEQLCQGGRLVAPLRINGLQKSIAFQRVENCLVSSSIRPCGFLRLRGEFQYPEEYFGLEGATIGIDDATRIEVAALKQLLTETPRREKVISDGDELRGFHSYLALRGESIFTMYADKEKYGFQFGMGLLSGTSSAVLLTQVHYTEPMSSQVHIFGDDRALVQFKRMLEEWIAEGRPQLDQSTITAAPIGTLSNGSNKLVIRKRWMEYEIDF